MVFFSISDFAFSLTANAWRRRAFLLTRVTVLVSSTSA